MQSILVLAAADGTGELAVASGLLITDALTVRVRHPLVRSAIYQAATDADRRRLHRVLADALAEAGDPDRETWHRAEGPDREVVDALEGMGSSAERRGGFAAALADYERAAVLASEGRREPS